MKVLVLHGENSTKSQERLDEVISKCKSGSWEILRPPATDLVSLEESFINSSLFTSKRLVVVYQSEKLTKNAISIISEQDKKSDCYLLLYSDKELPVSLLKSLPKSSKVESFKPSKYLWSFLESFFPGNSKMTAYLLKKTLQSEAPELIVALLSRHLADLYLLKSGGVSKTIPEWKVAKLSTQARHFSLEKIKEIISELSDADFKSKTGRADITFSLDMLVMTQLA